MQPEGRGYWTADGGANLDRSGNAADSIQWKFGVNNIAKHLERAHSMKLKECGVFDCYNKVSKVSSPANAKDCSVVAAAPGFVSATSSRSSLLSLLVIAVRYTFKSHPCRKR